MGLSYYDSTQSFMSSTDKFRPYIDGHGGGTHEEKIYIRNDDLTKWYSHVKLSLVSTAYDGLGELGNSPYSFKFMYGERRPTEAEWDMVIAGDPLELFDVGNAEAADISTYHPVWIRVWAAGGQSAHINDTFKLRLSYYPRTVGV